jgi:hypothetical protein
MKRSSLAELGVVSVIGAFFFIIAFCGCQPQPTGEIAVKVIVTQNFGYELVLDESVMVGAGANALDALEKVATVETRYGGGFVEAINGISSQYSQARVRKDWFFYVNGMSAQVGGLSYKLCHGDVEHWDFHDWSLHAFAPAIVGDFPQPFLGGYQGEISPTIIVYDEGFRDAARVLSGKLDKLGVENVRIAGPESSAYSKKDSNLILLGTQDFDLISELNGNEKLGFYIQLEEGKVVVYDSRGNEERHESECGLIQATQNPWNPGGISACENVAWMVSGTNGSQVQNAAAMLASRHEEFQYACAAVIVGEEVIKVPR